jgi:hypothetical protein
MGSDIRTWLFHRQNPMRECIDDPQSTAIGGQDSELHTLPLL